MTSIESLISHQSITSYFKKVMYWQLNLNSNRNIITKLFLMKSYENDFQNKFMKLRQLNKVHDTPK